MARMRPAAALLVLAVALAGCIGGPAADVDDPVDEVPGVRHLGNWENDAGVAVVATNSTDITGDGLDEVFAAQRDGSINALDPNRTREIWNGSYGSNLVDMVGVGGDRGPALAVLDDTFRLTSGPTLRLVDARNGLVLARRNLGDVDPYRIGSADLDDDGTADLVVLGERPTPTVYAGGTFFSTVVLAYDGGMEGEEPPVLGSLSAEDRMWREEAPGTPVDLVVRGDRVHVATSEGVTVLDKEGQTVYQHEEHDILDLAVDDGGSLVLSADKARRLDADGQDLWTRNVTAGDGAAAAVGDVEPGRSLVAETTNGTVRLHAYDVAGREQLNVTVGNLSSVADVAAIDVRNDGPRIAVAGVTDDGDAAVATVRPDGTVDGPVVAGAGHTDDRLASADVHADPGREIVLGRHAGYVDYFVG